jgi:hypothetical protein
VTESAIRGEYLCESPQMKAAAGLRSVSIVAAPGSRSGGTDTFGHGVVVGLFQDGPKASLQASAKPARLCRTTSERFASHSGSGTSSENISSV